MSDPFALSDHANYLDAVEAEEDLVPAELDSPDTDETDARTPALA